MSTRARKRSMGRVAGVWLAAGAGVAMLVGACDSPAKGPAGAKEPLPATPALVTATARGPALSPAPESADVAPPAWWQEGAQTRDGLVSVCAKADSKDLLVARREAMDSAMRVFRGMYGAVTGEPSMLADSARLADGTFRAYVKVSAGR